MLLLAASVLVAPSADTARAAPAASYQLIDLGGLGGREPSGDVSLAQDINSAGVVVGRAYLPNGAKTAFKYDKSGMQEVRAPTGGYAAEAMGINNNGVVVGFFSCGASCTHAFVNDAEGSRDLGTLPAMDSSGAEEVNDSGAVVGTSSKLPGAERAFIWTPSGGMKAAGPLDWPRTSGRDINSHGAIVGFGWAPEDPAFISDSGGTRQIPAPVDFPSFVHQVYAVNDDGHAVGEATGFANSGAPAFYYDGTKTRSLGTLGGFSARAFDVNNRGAVVGFSSTAGGDLHAFLYDGGEMIDLNSRIASSAGVVLREAYGINDSGQIVGRMIMANGDMHAFLLTPLPSAAAPPAEATYGPCDANSRWFASSERVRAACAAVAADPVTLSTGAVSTSATDARMPSAGEPFAFTRSYTSLDTTAGDLGVGWTDSYADALTIGADHITWRSGSGAQITFRKQPDGSFEADAWATVELTAVGGGYEIVTPRQIHYRFNGQGRLTSIKDRNGLGVTFAYNAQGKRSTLTDSAGRQVTLEYNGAGLLSRLALPDGRDVLYGYTSGRLTSVTDLRGGVYTYGYDAQGRLQSETDQNNHRVVFNVYGADGRISEQTDANNNVTRFGWNPTTQTATVTDARNHVWTSVFDRTLLVRQTDPYGNTTRYSYDAAGDLLTYTDALGRVESYTYDARHNRLTRRAPAPFSYEEVWTYNAFNDPLTYRDGRGNQTDYAYDAAGNLTTVTGPDPDGGGPLGRPVTTYGRDPAGTGLLVSLTDPRQKATQYAYDPATHMLASVTTPMGGKTTFTYDATGRMRTSVEPRGNVSGGTPAEYTTTYGYDDADHPTELTSPDPDGAGPQTPLVTRWLYDPAGNLRTATDANGRATDYRYDPANRLTSLTAPDPDGAGSLERPTTQYTYDEVGNLKTHTTGARTTTYGYDDANRLVSMTSPTGQLWTYGYDANSSRTSKVDANGNATATAGDGTTTYGYDVLGRLNSIDYSDSTADVSFAYDANHNRTQMTDGSGTETSVYDTHNRLTSVTRGSDAFSYTYDAAGNITGRSFPGGSQVSHTYDDDGRLATLVESGLTTSFGYDAAGNQTSVTLPAANGHVETRLYDRAGRQIEVKHEKGQTVLSRSTYTLDPVGNPTTIVRSSGTETYAYDGLDRLTDVCFQSSCPLTSDPFIRWTYDAVGNRLTEARPAGTTTYTYNAADQLTGRSGLGGSVTYAYDGNGNQIQAGPRTFAYDLADRMKSTTSGSTTISYAYDGLGKRLETRGDGTVATPTLRTPCSSATGTSGTATVNKPTGTVGGDLLVVGIAFEKGWDVAITPPSGWTLIRRDNQSSNVGYATYRRVAGASEGSSYAFGLSNSPKWSIGSCAIAGADATTPIDVHNGANASSGNPSAPSLTTTGASRLVLAFYANKKHATFSGYTPPALERWDAPNTSAGLPSNAMASYDLPAAGATGAKSATASEQAEWVAQQIAIAPSASVTRLLWDINHPLPVLALERNASNSLLRRYLHGNDLHSLHTPAGSFYYHADRLGSIANLTDSAGGKQWSYTWEPFGTARTQTQDAGSAPTNLMRFTGEYLDSTGLYHLRARQYDPSTGRFTTLDPLPNPTMQPYISAYVYANDRPTVLVDPSGLRAGTCGSIWCWIRTGIPNQSFGAGTCVGYCASVNIYRGDVYVTTGCCGVAPGRIGGEPVPSEGSGSPGEPAEESFEVGVCWYVCVGQSTDRESGSKTPTYGVGAPGIFVGPRQTTRIPGS